MSHSASKSLRDAYADGREIVVTGASRNPARRDGLWPVLYMPRSSTDKSPWVRADGFPFRYHAGELFDMSPNQGTVIRSEPLPAPDPAGWESVTA